MEFLVNIIPELNKFDMVDSEQNMGDVKLRQVFKNILSEYLEQRNLL